MGGSSLLPAAPGVRECSVVSRGCVSRGRAMRSCRVVAPRAASIAGRGRGDVQSDRGRVLASRVASARASRSHGATRRPRPRLRLYGLRFTAVRRAPRAAPARRRSAHTVRSRPTPPDATPARGTRRHGPMLYGRLAPLTVLRRASIVNLLSLTKRTDWHSNTKHHHKDDSQSSGDCRKDRFPSDANRRGARPHDRSITCWCQHALALSTRLSTRLIGPWMQRKR